MSSGPSLDSSAESLPPFALIASATSIAIVLLAVFARVPTYHFAPISLVPVTWALVLLRRKLLLHPAHYALVCLAILLHMLGSLGFYQKSPFPFSFDIAVHFYFAFAVAFVLHRFLTKRFPMLGPWQIRVTTLLFMMGFGALHEIMEYSTYLVLGEEKGMLKPATSYFFDTQRDLLNNLLGTILALIVRAVSRLARGVHKIDVSAHGSTAGNTVRSA